MQELLPDQYSRSGRLQHVESFRIYATSTGELVMPMGNVRMLVQPQDARQYLNDLIARAERLNGAHQLVESSSSNGHVARV
jgi:hypothetical protein